ncbi:CenpB-DNA-bind-domain-containing protein [Auricularia subglabra TFB-10046 SS5]|nr:CenpB-DNA-bind-domain-containing protein [Auricularia subglabra TFB-10046 SS5]
MDGEQQQQYLYGDAMGTSWPGADVSQDALFYHELDGGAGQYVGLGQAPGSAQPGSMGPGASSAAGASLGGVLTRAQRARQQLEHGAGQPPQLAEPLQMARRSPSVSLYAPQYQPMTIYPDAGAYMDPAMAPSPRAALGLQYHQGSPQYPSTPTTVSSAPSSRAYYSAGGRSTSPALSVASTSLTSLSGSQHASFHAHDAQHLQDCPMDGARDAQHPTFQPDASGPSSAGDHHAALNAEPLPPASGRVGRTRKTRLYNIDRKAICCYAKSHPEARQEDIAARYGVERSTISKILKQKQKWMNVPEGEELKIIKHRPSKFPALEKRLLIILKQCTKDKVHLTDQLIRSKARDVAKDIGISDDKFKASSGWVENFKHRHNIRRGVLIGRPRAHRTGSDGELTGDEYSDYEDRVLEGEEGLTKEQRLQLRQQKKEERLELFRLAEEQIMEEHGEQVEQGMIDEELRMELIVGRRAALLRAKREGKTLEQLNKPVEPIIISRPEEAHYVQANSRGNMRPYVLDPSYAAQLPGASGIMPYGGVVVQAPPPTATGIAAINVLANEAWLTSEERAVLSNMRRRVERKSSNPSA